MKKTISSILKAYGKINDTGKKEYNFLSIFFTLCLASVLITLLYGFFVVLAVPGGSAEKGAFGDMFGGLNSLFSGLAIAGVIITILIQKQELNLTRDELIRSANAQEQTQKALFEQLQSMQTSTKINAYQNYMNMDFDETSEEFVDWRITAKRSFTNEVENLLLRKSNSRGYQPELRLAKMNISAKGVCSAVSLKSVGPSFTFLDINKSVLKGHRMLLDLLEDREVKHGGQLTFHIEINENNPCTIISMIMLSRLTLERFSQVYYFY